MEDVRLDRPIPDEVFRSLESAPSGQGVLLLRDADGTPLSPHVVADSKAFLEWLAYKGRRGYCFSFEPYDDLADAVERCNHLVLLIGRYGNQ